MRILWRAEHLLGGQLSKKFLFINNQFRLLLCCPQGKQRQMYLIDQNLCVRRWLLTGSQRKKCVEKRMTDE